jgi:hypothetical protein
VACTVGFHNGFCYHAVIKHNLHISIKDYRRGNSLKVRLARRSFGTRQCFVHMNGERWPVKLDELIDAL